MIAIVACAQPTDGSLWIENRGGPALVVEIHGAAPVIVPCDGGAELQPGVGRVPSLPWQLVVHRAADGGLVLVQQVDELPRWLVLLGDEVVGGGLNPSPVEGPAGPPCV